MKLVQALMVCACASVALVAHSRRHVPEAGNSSEVAEDTELYERVMGHARQVLEAGKSSEVAEDPAFYEGAAEQAKSDSKTGKNADVIEDPKLYERVAVLPRLQVPEAGSISGAAEDPEPYDGVAAQAKSGSKTGKNAEVIEVPELYGVIEDPKPFVYSLPPPNPSYIPPEEVPRLRFNGKLKTVEDYMKTAHTKYLKTLNVSSSQRNARNPSASASLRYDDEYSDDAINPSTKPGFKSQSQKPHYVMPKGPCLDNTPDYLCTVQLAPYGVRYIVAKKELLEGLKEADDDYKGYALPFCCGGRASSMVLD